MILPDVLNQQLNSENGLHLTFRLPAELLWFSGHFPSAPILPGVTQVNWAMNYAETILGMNKAFSGMEVVKFQRPLLPEETVDLHIDWLKEKHRLVFRYCVGDAVASRGKITLCP